MTEEKKQENQGRIPRKTKKRLKKLQAQSKPIKTPKEKKHRLLKSKSTTIFPKRIPKLPTVLLNKQHYLFVRKHYRSNWVNYLGIEQMLLSIGKIKKERLSQNDKVINNYLALFKFIGLHTAKVDLDDKFMILESNKKRSKSIKSIKSIKCNSCHGNVERKGKRKKQSKQKGSTYKWKILEQKIVGKKTKPPIWVSEDIISQVEEKHYFISSTYHEISKGSEHLDFYTMRIALEKAKIINQFTRETSKLVEKYIVFYSFVGLYTDSYDLDAKIADFEKHQRKLREEAMQRSVEKMDFYEITDILAYFKRDPNAISKYRVLGFLRVIKSWTRILDDIDSMSQKDTHKVFVSLLEEIIENITILMLVSKTKRSKPTNFGKIIHLVKKLDKIQKPVIKQAV